MRSIRIFVIPLLLLCLSSKAQMYTRAHADSLQLIVKKLKGEERVKTTLLLVECYEGIQLDTALLYVEEALAISEDEEFDWGIHKSNYWMAQIKLSTSSVEEVKNLLNPSIDWFEEHGYEEDALYCHLTKILLLHSQGEASGTEDYVEDVFNRARKLGDPRLSGNLWFDMHLTKAVKAKGPLYQNSLDSSITLLGISGDSVALINANRRKNTYALGSPETFHFAFQSIKRAERWGHRRILCVLYRQLVYSYAKVGKRDSAMYFLDKWEAENILYGNAKSVRVDLYSTKAFVLFTSSKVADAAEWSRKAAEIYKELGHVQDELYMTFNTGFAYSKIERNDEAIQYLLKANKLSKRVNHDHFLESSNYLLAQLYTKTKQYDKAEHMYLESIAFTRANFTARVRSIKLGRSYLNLSKLFRRLERQEECLVAIDSAIAVMRPLGPIELSDAYIIQLSVFLDKNAIEEADTLYNFIKNIFSDNDYNTSLNFLLQAGRLKVKQKKDKQAIADLEKYINAPLITQIGFSEDKKTAYLLLYSAYSRLQNYKKALEYHVKLKAVNDSLSNTEMTENLDLILSKHELSEKESELQKLRQKQELQHLRMSSKNDQIALNRLYILLLSISVVLVIVVAFWLSYRVKAKRELKQKEERLKMEQKNIEAQKQMELSELKNELFANISHELRTPLTLIQVPVKEYLKDPVANDSSTLNAVVNNSEHLLQMIDEMLELSKMESGHFTLHPSSVSLAVMTQQLEASFKPLFATKEIAFNVENNIPEASIFVDHSRLKMALNNLLKNAYHHSDDKARVMLMLKIFGKKGIHITISNTRHKPLGFDEVKIFERNYRENENSYKGSGIGLAFSKQIVEKHGGTLEVDTSNEGFTDFHLKLPDVTLSLEDGDYSEMSASDQFIPLKESLDFRDGVSSGLKPNILVVEDHEEMRQLLHSVLADDFNIWLAKDGEEGEDLAIHKQPDLIISDVMMPNVDGLELLKSLKSNPDTSHIPVILLTAKAGDENKAIGFDVDADDYIEKPFDPTLLKSRLSNLIRQRKSLQKSFLHNPFLLAAQVKCSSLDQDFLSRAQQILEENYDNGEFSVTYFCNELALNRNSVHNKLKAFADQSTSQFIKNFRLSKAVQLLLETHNSIVEIGERTGFNSSQAFNKAFKEKFKITPSDYRKKKQAQE